jgi:hypothetical protein
MVSVMSRVAGTAKSNRILRNLQKELKHLTERVERTEAAENRRMLLELKTRTNIATIPDNHEMK